MSSEDGERYGDPATRDRILRATWDLVAERGDVAMGEVARRAGVSRQAVYLHFRDRSGLLLALVRHMDDALGLGDDLAHVFAAPTGEEALTRAVMVHSTFNPGIDAVARVLEAVRDPADPLAAAWRERMAFRHQVHVDIVERIEADGRLASGWTVAAAADLVHTVTLPATWRELTGPMGWSTEGYVAGMTRMLRGALLTPDPPGP